MWYAITREVSESIGQCELMHLARTPIDVARARRQHKAYEEALRSLGVEVLHATHAHDLPDAVFVEDTAVVMDETAIMTKPGAESRWGEISAVASILLRYRGLQWIEHDGRLDGGDVLRIDRTFYVGRSKRTNEEGIRQFRERMGIWGYDVQEIEVQGCLHLKSAVTQIAPNLLLINPDWLPKNAFAAFDRMEIDPREPFAANALTIAGAIIYPAHFPHTRERLERRSLRVIPIHADELAKAEGAVTCCSILFESGEHPAP